jgi:amino acid permease
MSFRRGDKTGWILASISICKSYFGVGALAMPFGFHTCGYQIALLMLSLNGILAFFTSHMLVEAKRRFQVNEQFEIKTYADLGFAAYGWFGYVIVASLVFLNQFMTGISYALFFLQ